MTEQEDVKKLVNIVEESLETIAKLTRLPISEVLHIIEEVDVVQLRAATQGAIKKIADATDLDTAQITTVFKAKRAADVEDICNRLREEGRAHRARW
jgi:phosphoribosylanthranilate isomerase